jgi:phage terminase Nu1 subunit (DNA packaging protein)
VKRRGIAEFFGVSLTTVGNWGRRGAPLDGEAADIAKWVVRTSGDGQAAAARARLTAAKAGLAEITLKKAQGKLVDAEGVVKTWERAMSAIRSRLLAIPTKAAPLVIGCVTAPGAFKIIQDMIYEALNELSEGHLPPENDEGSPGQ